MSLSKIAGEKEWVVTFTDDNVGLFTIGVAYIHSDSENFSSLITMLPTRVIIAL
jgi:hypothetical protein